MNPTDRKSRFRGCLLAGAAGDALGNPVEFASLAAIVRAYGSAGVTRYSTAHGECAVFTDDTQMSLFTANGLLRCSAKRSAGQQTDELSCIREAYLDWYRTQSGGPLSAEEAKRSVSWLMEIPSLYARRAPGNTCLSALQKGGRGTLQFAVNHSKGCGGVMRTAPAGLWADSAETAFRIGAEAAAVTHSHPLGWIPAGMLSHMVWGAAYTDEPLRELVPAAIREAERFAADYPEDLSRQRSLLHVAIRLAESREMPDWSAIEVLGGGWVGEEALAIAVYCALRYPEDLPACLTAAVTHSGDSDSTGAIAGNLLGARLGAAALPEELLTDLQDVPLLTEIADDLYSCAAGETPDAGKYLR